MLSRIYIKNFALIDTLEVSLKNGLQVITGETGAGKSIILGALRLILGERADVKSISKAEEKSVVETEFALNNQFKKFFIENDLDYELHTIIRREILPSGKSRAFINDVPVTLDVLKELSSQLIDIHSQFETSNLFTSEYQFKIIDGLSENKKIIEDYQREFSDFQTLKVLLKKLKTQLSETTKESDYKEFLLNELEELKLDEVDFELELIRRDEITVDYIIGLVAKMAEAGEQEKSQLRKQIAELVNGNEKLRSKRELIDKFITSWLPHIADSDSVEGEFQRFWGEQEQHMLEQLAAAEGFDLARLRRLIDNYNYTGRLPRSDEYVAALKDKPRLSGRRALIERLKAKVCLFIDTFIE